MYHLGPIRGSLEAKTKCQNRRSPRRVAFWLVYAFGNLAFAFVWLLGQVPGSSHPDLLDYSPRLFNAALMAASILIDKNIRKNKKPVSHQDPQTVMNIVLA